MYNFMSNLLRTEVHAYMNSLNFDINGLLRFKNKTSETVRLQFDEWFREEIHNEKFITAVGEFSKISSQTLLKYRVSCA